MKKRIKKTALFMIVFGFVITVTSLWFGFEQYGLLQQGAIDSYGDDIVGIILGFVAGLLFLVFGFIWFYRKRRSYGLFMQLKRFGKKTHARYLHQEQTNHTIDGHPGVILYLQDEDSNRVFQTKPIHSEFSVKWLEEHIFDVYIDISDSDNYYIDMEKHFGEPVSAI